MGQEKTKEYNGVTVKVTVTVELVTRDCDKI
jgi:hypothetical protein